LGRALGTSGRGLRPGTRSGATGAVKAVSQSAKVRQASGIAVALPGGQLFFQIRVCIVEGLLRAKMQICFGYGFKGGGCRWFD
jgi:hypothetical protein